MNPYYASQEDERHGWHCHHTIVEIACIVNTLRDKLEAEQRATTKQLAQTAYCYKDVGIAKTVAHAIEE